MISKGSSVDFCLLLGYFAKKKLKWHLKYSFSYLKCSKISECDIKNTKKYNYIWLFSYPLFI